MFKYLVIVFTLFFAGSLFAQDVNIEGTVFSTDSIPLQYTVVFDKVSKSGIYTDSLGRFRLTVPKETQRLRISRLGYIDKTILINTEELGSYNIFLQQDSLKLSEVVVKAKHFRRKKIKMGPARKDKTFFRACRNFSLETGIFIPNKSRVKGELLGVVVYLKNESDENDLLRLRVYKPNNKFEPSKDLLLENVIIKVNSTDRIKHYIDLQRHMIPIPPNGIIVTIEWLKNTTKIKKEFERNCSGVKVMRVENRNTKYIWWSRLNQGLWQNNTELLRVAAEKQSLEALYTVPCIQLKVREYDLSK